MSESNAAVTAIIGQLQDAFNDTLKAQLIASLFGLTDEQLDARPASGDWSARIAAATVL